MALFSLAAWPHFRWRLTTGDGGLVSDISGFTIKDLGAEQYGISLSVWTKTDDQTINTDLGAFTCKFKDSNAGFTGLFWCAGPENSQTLTFNSLNSKLVESVYFYNGQLQTSNHYEMEAYLTGDDGYPAGKHLDWGRVKCDSSETFDRLVNEFRTIR